MKAFLLFLLFCFSFSVFGQAVTAPAYASDFSTENVAFNSAGITLAGTIFKPKAPYAAIVLVHGSGQETRMMKR